MLQFIVGVIVGALVVIMCLMIGFVIGEEEDKDK